MYAYNNIQVYNIKVALWVNLYCVVLYCFINKGVCCCCISITVTGEFQFSHCYFQFTNIWDATDMI